MIIAMNRFEKNPEGMTELIMSPFQGLVMLDVFALRYNHGIPSGL
jgi:hypothetical protein